MSQAAGPGPMVELSVPADMRYLPLVRRLVEDQCLMWGFDAQTMAEVVLATEEACTNIVVHAYRGRSDGRLSLRCRLEAVGLEILLEDDGEPFDGNELSPPDPAEVRPGGRGVFLIRSVMDEVEYRPKPGAGTVLRLFKRFPRSAAQKE